MMGSGGLLFAVYMIAILAFLVFCVVVGRRRWAQVQANSADMLAKNTLAIRLSEEAVADRKKILAVLEDIHSLLKDRKV
jgi:cytochrome c biogenesis protein ResB